MSKCSRDSLSASQSIHNGEAIDLMHNDVKKYFCGSRCIVVVVVTSESNMASYKASYLPEAGNLNAYVF